MVKGKRIVVRLDGTPAQENDPEHLIRYIANEGTRVSRIYESLRKKQTKSKHAANALSRMLAVSSNPELGPLDLRSSPILIPGGASASGGGAEEITRRKLDDYRNAKGYKPTFLGPSFRIGLPRYTSELKRELAPLRDAEKHLLDYDNYSLAINRERRTAFFVAANVDGSKLWKTDVDGDRPTRPAWSYDPRMLEEYQPDDEIFSNTIARGHLYKREDATWGKDKEAINRADRHSFTITNATPMISGFNNVEWGDLEDLVTKELKGGRKLSYFAGPVFRSSDPYYYELTSFSGPSGNRRTGMRIPLSFWKIVAWIEGGNLKAAGFILQQSDELKAHGTIEEIDFGNYKKRRIKEIEDRTVICFSRKWHTFSFFQVAL
jgi:endonuclease G